MKHVRIEDYRPRWFNWKCDPDTMRLGELDGSPAWTDGCVLCLGEPPEPISDHRDFRTVVAMGTRTTLAPIRPLGVVKAENKTVVVFEFGITIRTKFYHLILEKWPNAEWFGDGREKSVAARVDGKLVALVMPIRMDYDALLELFQSANAGKSQSVESAEESANNKAEGENQ